MGEEMIGMQQLIKKWPFQKSSSKTREFVLCRQVAIIYLLWLEPNGQKRENVARRRCQWNIRSVKNTKSHIVKKVYFMRDDVVTSHTYDVVLTKAEYVFSGFILIISTDVNTHSRTIIFFYFLGIVSICLLFSKKNPKTSNTICMLQSNPIDPYRRVLSWSPQSNWIVWILNWCRRIIAIFFVFDQMFLS